MIRFVTCGFVTSLLAFFKLNAAQYEIHGFIIKTNALEPIIFMFGVLTFMFLIIMVIKAIDKNFNEYH